MVDTIWEGACHNNTGNILWQTPFVSPSPGVLYGIFANPGASRTFQLRKSTDFGASWSDLGVTHGVNIQTLAWYYDRWTDGDNGTLIHAVYQDRDAGNAGTWYFTIDTTDDTISADVNVDPTALTGEVQFFGHQAHVIKKRDGNLSVVGTTVAGGWHYISTDGGASWVAAANPYEDNDDYAIPSPGYEVDPADFVILYWDRSGPSGDEIRLKTYDDSLDSYSDTLVTTVTFGSTFAVWLDIRQRWANQSSVIGVWNDQDTATADLEGWIVAGDAVGGYTITATALVVENQAESYLCGVCIDQQNDHIYVCWTEGTVLSSLNRPFYRRSDDGGVSWGPVTGLSENVEDDLRFVQLSGSIGNSGGEIQGNWNNDDTEDMLTNVNTAISIPVFVPPEPPPVAESSRYGSPILVAPGNPFYGSQIDQEASTLPQYGQVHANRTGFPTYGQVRIDRDASPSYGQGITKLS